MIEAPEAPHHHHHKTGLPWFDLIVPIAVLCISVASLLTALQSEKSMHALVEQNTRLVDAQSTPLLMLDSGNEANGKMELTMTLSNVGTGPAQIAWFRIHDDQGTSYDGGALYERLAKMDPKLSFTSEIIGGTSLRTGDARKVFSWPMPTGKPAEMAEWNRLNEIRFRLHASACYCSIFDECRVTTFDESKPRLVRSCEAETGKR